MFSVLMKDNQSVTWYHKANFAGHKWNKCFYDVIAIITPMLRSNQICAS